MGLDQDASAMLRDLVAEVVQHSAPGEGRQGAVERAFRSAVPRALVGARTPAGLSDALRRYALRVIDSNVRAQQHGELKLLRDVDDHYRSQGRDSSECAPVAAAPPPRDPAHPPPADSTAWRAS